MKNILAILLGLALWLVVETVLLLVGITSLAQSDPFVGFSGSTPLFIPSAVDASEYERNPVKKNYFNPQSFRNPKPQGTFRIVSFGGSTTYGRPYLDDTSFSAWLDKLLAHEIADLNFRHVNAGGISYASYRSLRLMEEMSRFEPDLYVVYSGHNEFLEERTFAKIKDEAPVLRKLRGLLHRSRIYSLLQRAIDDFTVAGKQPGKELADEVSARLEKVGGPDLYRRDPEFRRAVIDQYRYTIGKMLDLATEKEIPLILCTLPTNLSGVSPFKSEHRANLSAGERWRWQQIFQRAEKAIEDGKYSEGLSALLEAETIDPQFALLHYRKGQVLQVLGRTEEALLAYIKAKEEDIIPLRALDEFNAILHEVSAARNVPLADIDAVFKRVSPAGIPGANLFADHVHPTIEGQQLAAWVILDTAVKYGLVPLQPGSWQRNVVSARDYLRSAATAISPRYRAMGLWGVGRLYFWAGKYPEAYLALNKAWQEVKDVAEIPMELGIIELSRGNSGSALRFLTIADLLSPGSSNILLPLANAYSMAGQGRKALQLLDPLADSLQKTAAYHYSRAKALLAQGDQIGGERAMTLAVRLAPETVDYRAELAEILAMNGVMVRAQEEYQTYLQLSRHPDPQQALLLWLDSLEGESSSMGGN